MSFIFQPFADWLSELVLREFAVSWPSSISQQCGCVQQAWQLSLHTLTWS